MNKRKVCVAFIVLLTCAFAGQALAQDSEIKFNSNADDLAKIRSVLEEFRQDIIHKDGYALTKLVLNPMCSFITSTTRKKLIAPANVTLSSMGLAQASSMDLRNYSLRRRTNSKKNFAISRFARTVI